MKTITVNGITYPAKEFNFNTVCDFEDMGITLEQIGEKPMATLRAYVSICIGKGKDFAGEQMQEHILNGGGFDDIANVMTEQIGESDFFRKLNESQPQTIGENQKKRTTKKTAE